MTGAHAGGPRRVRMPYVERLAERLSARDRAVVATVDRVRLITGLQLERLHFSDLSGRSRSVMRWRVLKRLADARVLVPLDRRIGTSRRGSGRLCYGLDSGGLQLVRLRINRASEVGGRRVRRPRIPGERFVAHTLAVTELYVALREQAQLGRLVLEAFQVEAAAYWPNGLGGRMKPDAFIRVRRGAVTDYWWYEADLATESVPTIRAKLAVYLDFVNRGQLGPDGVVPRVLIGVPTPRRLVAIRAVVNRLPGPARALFLVAPMPMALSVLTNELMK